MKKMVGVFSLIVLLLTQVLTPYAYAVGDLNPIAEETPMVEVIDEPEAPVEEVGDDAGSDDLSENPVIDELGEDLEDGAGLGESTSGEDGDASVVTEGDSAESGEVSEVSVDPTDEGIDGEESKSTLDKVADAVSNVVDAVVDVFLGETEETIEEVDESIYASEELYGTSSHKGVKVEVYAETGAFKATPDLDISVVESKKESEIKKVILEYNEDTEDLNEEEKEQVAEEKITEVVAFDIKFLDKETGEERQPREGKVRVSFNYNESETLEETEEHEIKVYHLDDKDEKGNTIEEIKDMEVDEPEVTENREVEEVKEETKEENEEQQVVTVIGDKFSIYTIVQQVKEEGLFAENENQLANFVYGEISIARPEGYQGEGPAGFTIMDRNLGAIGTGYGASASTGSYGYHYQRGNNYGFDSSKNASEMAVTGIKVNVSGLTGYYSSTFVTGNTEWMAGGSSDILWNGDYRQGPCPDGWHVPSALEWNKLLEYYYGKNEIGELSHSASGYAYVNGSEFSDGFVSYFQLPFAGYRHFGSANIYSTGSFSYLWSTTPYSAGSNNARFFFVDGSQVKADYDYLYRGQASSVRCFKDNYMLGNFHTITFDFNGGSGSTASINVLSGGTGEIPSNPVKLGYTFLGWYETGSNIPFDFTGTVITGDVELYAKYGKTVEILGDDDSRNTFTYGTIQIGDYVIMDRNLGAKEVWNGVIGDANIEYLSYGYYYQWGNNWGFSSNTSSSDLDQEIVVSDEKIPSKYSNSGWNEHNPWSTQSNLWGDEIDTDVARQGPCPVGWHVPSSGEWKGLYDAWASTKTTFSPNTFAYDLNLPFAGYRYYNFYNIGYRTSKGSYFSSSSFGNNVYVYTVDPVYSPYLSDTNRTDGRSVRCFQNSKHTVSFSVGGEIVLNQQVIGGMTAMEPSVIPETDYGSFSGWYLTGEDETYDFNTTIDDNITLYARWNCDEGYIESSDGNSCVENAATLLAGTPFNMIVKGLANPDESNISRTSNDFNITGFVKTGSLTTEFTTTLISITDSIPVYAWYDNGIIYFYTEAEKIYLNVDSSFMFGWMEGLQSIDLSVFDTKNVETMNQMFSFCESMTSFDFSTFNTSNLIDVSGMINDCTSLVSLNMDNWDLRQLNFMTSITALTPNLETISARNWKLPYNANNWTNNWNFCSSWNPNTLRSIDVTNWEFSGGSIWGMFYGCRNVEEIIGLNTWDTSNITNMTNLFINNEKITTLDLSSWDFSSVGDANSMFQGMSSLKTIYAQNGAEINYNMPIFDSNDSLVGGYGTKYDNYYTNKSHAKIDNTTQSGYFTDPNNFAVAYILGDEVLEKVGGKKINDTATALSNPTHTTYTYYVDSGKNEVYNFSTPLKAYTEIYVGVTCGEGYGLYGNECIAKHSITVEGSGSTINLTSSMEDNYLSGDEVTLSFLGDPDGKISWTSSPEISITSSNSGHTISFIMPDEDLTLIPTIAAYHEVIFDVSENGLNFHPSEVVQNLVSGDLIDLSLYTGFRNGYEFVGWNTDKDAEEKIGDTYIMIDSDVTLYAIYRKALTGSFIGNGNKLEGNQDEIDRDCYMYNKKTSCEIVVPSIVENEHTKTILGYSESSNTGSAILVKSGVELNSGAIANGLLTISIGESFIGYAQTVAPAKTYTAIYKIGTGDEVVLKILKESDSCTIGAVYNGNNDSDQSVDCTLISPVILTAEGYEGYWDGPMKGNIEFAMASDRTIYAWSTGMHYGITYYLGEDGYWGEGVVATGSYQEGDSFTLPVPSRDGYTFLGWTTNAETTPGLNKKIETTDSGAKFFVAHWRQDNYRISYIDLEPGTTNMVTGYNYNAAKSLNQPNKSRRGYVFTGWIGSNGDVPQKEVTIPQYSLGDKSYTAVWSPVVYNVTGYLNGGKIDNKDTYTFTYTVESDNITLAMPTRDNSTFVGWTGSNGSAADRNVTIANGSIGDREYYAVYTCNEGYEPSGNTCVLKPYNVTYELDGGKHTTTNVSGTVIKINDSYKITIKNPIKTGHVFKGWTANVSNITCKEGNTVRAMCRAESANDLTIEFTEGQDITLTATWEHLPIAVTLGSLKKVNNSYEIDGTSVTMDYAYTDTIELLAEQKTGYETKGWSESTEGVIKYKDDVIKNVSDLTIIYPIPSAAPDANAKGTATLYAVRDIITYTIVYKLGGGSHSNPMTYKVTDANITLTDPVKTGYDFKGWYDDEENKITVINQDVISGLTSPYKLILTAEWEASKNTPYKVYHERQGIDGNYHKDDLTQTEVEDLSGETNTTITPARKSYIGFITPIDQKSAKVEADGSTEVEYFYTRAQYDYTLTDVLGAATVGTTATNHDMYYETPITLKGDAETGYTWSGWIIESGDQTTFNPNKEISFTMPLNDVTVTPVVIHNKWRLSFDANEGTGDVESLAEKYPVYYNDIIDFPVVTKTGYTFSGWYSGDVRYDLPVKNMPDSDLVLIAHWSAEPFVLKVNHYKMNLSGEYPETPTKIVSINTEIDADLTGTTEARILPETYTGFTLSGDAVEGIHINSDGSSVINYYYIRDKHNVSITENDGVMLSGTLLGEYYYGTTINVEAEAKTGYTWSGWNVTSGGETSFTELTGLNFILSTGDIELTPLTTTNTYHLTIRDGDTIYFSGDVEYLSVITLPATPSKNGYSFNGWVNYPSDGKMVAHDLEITASWASSYRPTGGPGGNSSSSSSSSDNKKVFVNTGTQEQEHGTAELTGTNNPLNETGVDDKQVKKDDIKPIEDMGFEEVKSVTADQLNRINKSSFTKEQIEILDAYQWAYEHNITTMVTLRDANPEGVVTRGHLAKMVVNYAINVLGQQLPEKTPVECRWNDWRTDWESQEIKDYAVKACALGLMGLDMYKFQPKVWVSRAQFGTIMSRLLWGKKYAGGKPYYRNHLKALKENGIMTQIGNPEGRTEIRQWVWLMLMRATKDQNKG